MKYFVVSLLVVCAGSRALGARPRLPSLNGWDMCGNLIRSEVLQLELEISPDQLAALKALRADSEIARIFAFKEKKLRHQHILATGDSYDANTLRRIVTLELDGLVQTRLKGILSPQQLEHLPVTVMKERYKEGYKAFVDPEVQEHCGFDAVNLIDVIRKEKREVEEKSAKVALRSCRELVAKLPPRLQTKVVYYFGTQRFPSLRISQDDMEKLKAVDMPFPPHGGGSLVILSDASVRSSLEIASQQLSKIKTLRDELSEARSRLKPTPTESVKDYTSRYFALHRKHREKTEQVLTWTQRQQIGRLFAFGEYQRDPTRLFDRREFTDYLSASQDELDQARQAATQQMFTLRRVYRDFNRQCFYNISSHLEPESKTRLTELFSGVWEK